MEFRVGFLKDHYPQFVLGSGREYGASIYVAREVVIHCNGLPLSVLAQSHSVDSFLIVYLINEQFLNELWLLCQSHQSTYEPRIPQGSLSNINGLYLLLEHFGFCLLVVFGSPELDLHVEGTAHIH